MDSQIVQSELQLMAGAIALGAMCAIVATLVLFPVIDRYVRPRFRLERGSAMIVLLAASLVAGLAGGVAGYFWLRDREADRLEDPGGGEEAKLNGPAVFQSPAKWTEGGDLQEEDSAIGNSPFRDSPPV